MAIPQFGHCIRGIEGAEVPQVPGRVGVVSSLAERKAQQELNDQRADVDFARVAADMKEQAALLRTVRKFRDQKNRV